MIRSFKVYPNAFKNPSVTTPGLVKNASWWELQPCVRLFKFLNDTLPAPPAMPGTVNKHKVFSHDTAPFFILLG
jgi:hypothetical protein